MMAAHESEDEVLEQTEQTFKYTVSGGALYVTVQQAVIQRAAPWEERKYKLTPRVQVHSDPYPARKAHGARGWLKVHNRRYRVDTRYQRWTRPQCGLSLWSIEGVDGQWGGVRDENLFQINSSTKAHRRLDEIVGEVLDLFAVQHPEWEKESERLGLVARRGQLQRQAADALNAHREAEKSIADVDALLSNY
jgi:hypothetical protein